MRVLSVKFLKKLLRNLMTAELMEYILNYLMDNERELLNKMFVDFAMARGHNYTKAYESLMRRED